MRGPLSPGGARRLTDNGPAYRCKLLNAWLRKHGVLHLFNLPHTTQHNPQAERTNGLLKAAAEIGPEAPPITSHADAIEALVLGARRLADRPRAVLDGQTTDERHRVAPRWYTQASRKEVLDDARRAREHALRDLDQPRARRRAEPSSTPCNNTNSFHEPEAEASSRPSNAKEFRERYSSSWLTIVLVHG